MSEYKFPTSVKDEILVGITFESLITAVQSNERLVNKQTVKRVYKELLAEILDLAKWTLDSKMDFILKELDSWERADLINHIKHKGESNERK